MTSIALTDNRSVYTDLASLQGISVQGRENTAEGLRAVAKQFESLFINMMLKSVRETNGSLFEDNYLRSKEMDFHQENLDNQLSLHLSEAGGFGLAEVLYRQMAGNYSVKEMTGTDPSAAVLNTVTGNDIRPRQPAKPSDQAGNKQQGFSSPDEFVRELTPLSRQIGSQLGVESQSILAQAALETGWGKAIPQRADGSSTHNLFGIKADAAWQGDRARITTLEHENGVMKKQEAVFRAYASFAESFQDYANFLRNNPRYQLALKQAEDPAQFAESLQRAGYATDPHYASKIEAVRASPAMQAASARLAMTAMPGESQ
ncbi:MAG: flagellar assembly peptidoglycan hydrolase FlgJ [Pseudomonadales bacterium]|nr:flagellar assembly peptidoglycan hydrolase FlgJ [Pseudomonadales bacterium]